MFTRRLRVVLAVFFATVLTVGIVVVACEQETPMDDELQYIAGDVTLTSDPAYVKLETGNQIYLSVSVTNSGRQPISAWALDLGNNLYLVTAEPKEQKYHKGKLHSHDGYEHSHDGQNGNEHGHGNVLLYGIPVEPGNTLQVKLHLGVLFDIEGKLDDNPELRLSYAKGTSSAQTLSAENLSLFENTFLTYPSVVDSIYIER